MSCCPCPIIEHSCILRKAGLPDSLDIQSPRYMQALDDVYALEVSPIIGDECFEELCDRLTRRANGESVPENLADDTALRENMETFVAKMLAYYFDIHGEYVETPSGPLTDAPSGYLVPSSAAKARKQQILLRRAEAEKTKFIKWFEAQLELIPNPYPCAVPDTNCECVAEKKFIFTYQHVVSDDRPSEFPRY